MFTCWRDLLPELRAYVRTCADPLAQAHLAMTCQAEDTYRWNLYLTRFSGTRDLFSYSAALAAHGSDAFVHSRYDDMPVELGRELLRHKRDQLLLSVPPQRRKGRLDLWKAFNSRYAALQWIREWRDEDKWKSAALQHAVASWNLIEGIGKEPAGNFGWFNPAALWAEAHHDVQLLARLYPLLHGRYTAVGDTVRVDWLEILLANKWDVALRVTMGTPVAVLKYAIDHTMRITWFSGCYDDLDVEIVYHQERPPCAVEIGHHTAIDHASVYRVSAGYWPRYIQHFNAAWECTLLRTAIRGCDYALIVWLLARACGVRQLRYIDAGSLRGRLKDQLMADGWLVDGHLVNKNTGERLPIAIV
jgi:hypothetical protein